MAFWALCVAALYVEIPRKASVVFFGVFKSAENLMMGELAAWLECGVGLCKPRGAFLLDCHVAFANIGTNSIPWRQLGHRWRDDGNQIVL